MTIAAQKIRDLPLSAASGLVIIGDAFYVVADDDLHLHGYSLADAYYEKCIRLIEGQLPSGTSPDDKKARKKVKPDFEALVQLPPSATHPHGALLALGSGSKANRQRAVLVPLDAQRCATHEVTELDLAPLYASVKLDDCNIEGAVVCGEQLVLLQRGNQSHENSALVLLPLSAVGERSIAPGGAVIHCDMPKIDGCPFGFTDGLCLPNGNILFAAVAEATDDSYNDGACLGAAIGEITLQGELLRCERLSDAHKIEGIALDASGTRLYAVTDADDPAIPAGLYELGVPAGWLT